MKLSTRRRTPAPNLSFAGLAFGVFGSILATPNAAEACIAPPTVQISNVTPVSTLSPGDRIEIHGSGFSQLQADARVYFDARLGGPGFGATSPIWIDSDTHVHAYVPNEAESGDLFIKQWVHYHGGCPNGGTVPAVPGSSTSVLHLVGTGPSVQIDNKLPSAPIVEATAISGSQVILRWITPNIPTIPERNSFVIRVSDDFGETWQLVQTIYDPSETEYTVGGLQSATVYAFEVAAYGPSGETRSLPDDWGWARTFGNTGGTGRVFVSGFFGVNALLCGASPTVHFVESYFDKIVANGQGNGVVDNAMGTSTAGNYPVFSYFVTDPNDLFAKPVRKLSASSSYGRNIAYVVRGNLVVTGYICGSATPQFVSLHLAVFQPPGSQPIVQFVRMDAGDRVTFVPERHETGVVMSGFEQIGDSGFDLAALQRAQPRAIGWGESTVSFLDYGTQQSWSARVRFEFDTPILVR